MERLSAEDQREQDNQNNQTVHALHGKLLLLCCVAKERK
jgi:hypothetical protein